MVTGRGVDTSKAINETSRNYAKFRNFGTFYPFTKLITDGMGDLVSKGYFLVAPSPNIVNFFAKFR